MSGNQGVKVFARIRPTSTFSAETIELHPDNKSLTIHTRKDERRGYINNQILDWTYQTDHVLHNASQPEVFKRCAGEPIMKSLDGYNSTIIAYGETGAGKSFTMSGSCENFQERGIIPRTVSKIFSEISNRKEQSIWVRISYLEIYNESMYDLLATIPGTPYIDPSSFTVTEDECQSCRVKGLSVHMANTEEEALNLFFEVGRTLLSTEENLKRVFKYVWPETNYVLTIKTHFFFFSSNTLFTCLTLLSSNVLFPLPFLSQM